MSTKRKSYEINDPNNLSAQEQNEYCNIAFTNSKTLLWAESTLEILVDNSQYKLKIKSKLIKINFYFKNSNRTIFIFKFTFLR